MPAPVRVLIVDDSAFARKVVREILEHQPGIEVVGTARDGEEALDAVEALQPDLVVCDLLMPRMDGAEFVRRQMARRPIPILILSAEAQDAAAVMDALNAGAVDVVQKPTVLATDDLRSVQHELVEKISARIRLPDEPVLAASVATPAISSKPAPVATKIDIVVIGISTGGPQALRRIVPRLPADFPVPVAIVMHMPVGYTALFAEKLNEVSALEVKEAAEGDLLKPGRVLIAAAGRHLAFGRAPNGSVVAHLPAQPLEKLHRPSVDVLFRSAAEVYRERALGIVMTGMGDDGKEGAAWIKAYGGTVVTESESSCVIFGMPRSVVEAGLSDLEATLDQIVPTILEKI